MKKIRGFALLEVLIAVGIVGTGLLSVGKLQSFLTAGNSLAKQRTEALVVTQKKIEELRGFGTLTTGGAVAAYDGISAGNDTVSGENSTFTRTWTVTNDSNYKTIKVVSSWTSNKNEAQTVSLESVIGRIDPAEAGLAIASASTGSLITTPTGSSTSASSSSSSSTSSTSTSSSSGGELSTSTSSTSSTGSSSTSSTSSTSSSGGGTSCSNTRNSTIPTAAVNNCDGTSTYRPIESVALTYNNTSGSITLVNGATARSISGTLTIASAGNAPSPGKTTSNVTITSAASNIYCFYTASSSATANYSCYVSTGWSGSVVVSGSSGFKVCRSYVTSPYSSVNTDLSTQSYGMIKSSKECSSATPATPTLHQSL